MTLRHNFRWFLWASCALVALLSARPAKADAPMCDERGMSVDAPPPVMPIRDARIDRGDASFCRSAALVLDLGRQVQRGPEVVDPTPVDAGLEISDPPPIGAAQSGILSETSGGLVPAPAHTNGVFRPPRAA